MRGFWAAVRSYWSAALLGIPAAGLLAGSAAVKGTATTALIGAGSALAGAAATRVVDLAKERRPDAAQTQASRDRDLDETRRVAYMALLASSTDSPELAATIVNALAHHGSGVDPDEAAGHVANLLSKMPVNRPASEQWLKAQIDNMTSELGQARTGAALPPPGGCAVARGGAVKVTG